MMNLFKKFKKFSVVGSCNRGVSIIEFAFVGPLYLLIVFGIIAWAYLLFELNAMQMLTEMTARCAVLPAPQSGAVRQCLGGDVTQSPQEKAFFNNNDEWIVSADLTDLTRIVPPARIFATSSSFMQTCISVPYRNKILSGVAFVPSYNLRIRYCRPSPTQ